MKGFYVFYNEQWSCIFHPMLHEISRCPSVWILSPDSQSYTSKHQHHNPLLTPRLSSPSNPSTLGVLGVGGCLSQRPAVIGPVEPVTSEEVWREGEGKERGSVQTPCWLVREALDRGQDTHTHRWYTLICMSTHTHNLNASIEENTYSAHMLVHATIGLHQWVYTDTHKHTHPPTHTHTHTHTHTQWSVLSPPAVCVGGVCVWWVFLEVLSPLRVFCHTWDGLYTSNIYRRKALWVLLAELYSDSEPSSVSRWGGESMNICYFIISNIVDHDI